MELSAKVDNRRAKVAVIGLGYVGLPLAMVIADAGFQVTGIDKERVRQRVAKETIKSRIEVTADYARVQEVDIILIAVPTPLTKEHDPDLSQVISAAKNVAKNLRKNKLVILESTTYPGTTEEVLVSILSKNGFTVGKDILVGYSPERIDPGNKDYEVKNIPKVVSGVTPECALLTELFYRQFIDKVVRVSSTRVAEMTKILENVFRSVNVALVNELALLCDRMKIDVWEVVQAASTKPFGFMSFKPGPGLGGHCVPIDPFYLSWKAREYEFHTEFIELAGKVNENMPYFVVEKIGRSLSGQGKAIKGAKILLLGVAYKKDISDIRKSPALRIIELLMEREARVSYHDPHVPKVKVNGSVYQSLALGKEMLKDFDLVTVVVDHSAVDYPKLVKHSNLILDTRNVLANFKDEKIVRL